MLDDEDPDLVALARGWFDDPTVVVNGRAVTAGAPLAAGDVGPGSVIAVGQPAGSAPCRDEPMGCGVGVFHRPPRIRAGWEPSDVPLPPPLPEVTPPARFGWAALAIPVVLGVVMAVLFSPRMALFAVFSPAMMLANWVEDRRRVRRERHRRGDTRAHDLADLEERLVAATAASAEAACRDLPSPDRLARRALRHDPSLWERRPGHDDFLRLGIGTGCLPWPSPLGPPASWPADVAAVADRHDALHEVPVPVHLAPGAVLGIAGARGPGLALARAVLLQAVVLHGPADLQITVITESPADWDWAKWLPHTVMDDAGRRRLAAGPAAGEAVVAALPPAAVDRGTPAPGPCHLVVLDGDPLAAPVAAQLRRAVQEGAARRVCTLALAPCRRRLPSACTMIVELPDAGPARLSYPDRARVDPVEPWYASGMTVRMVARALAPLEDPELDRNATHLPDGVRLLDLLAWSVPDPSSVAARWDAAGPGFPPVAVGVTEEGPLQIDLVADGPHALLAGTTGSGKSELLRTLVASLAATVDPGRLTFVLVDYKGGSAFDACASLPHTVGVVTDLDGHLARRALLCLEAELRYREERLRQAEVADIADFRPGDGESPLPRLLVIVDEFAALAQELPDFLDALVDVAQRGRSLGVHLLLATQRPSGVVGDAIRANTNLRLSLRVQDRADSVDVVGVPHAADLGRHQPGRGFVRKGPGEVVAFQAARVSGGAAATTAAVAPFVFAHEQPPSASAATAAEGTDDLAVLVAAITEAARRRGIPPPRSPWPDPLPSRLLLADVVSGEDRLPAAAAPLGWADEPQRQRLSPVWWSPADGNLLLFGLRGSGTTSTLATIATGLARATSPDDVHLTVLDCDDQLLGPLADLPHVGAVIGATDRERQLRVLRRLHREVQERRRLVATDPAILDRLPVQVVLVDGFAGLTSALDEPGELGLRTVLTRVMADGPGAGVVFVATAKQPGDVPGQVAAAVAAKLAFRLADRYDYAAVGITVDEPAAGPGRCFSSVTGREIQVALPHPGGIAAAVAEMSGGPSPSRPPAPVGILPAVVKVPEIAEAARVVGEEWVVPIGIGDTDLEPVGFLLRDGDHALVAGPGRSGKSTALEAVASLVAACRPDIEIHAVTPRRSPLLDCPEVARIELSDLDGMLGAIVASGAEHLVLVDDAELVDGCEALASLLAGRIPGVHLVAAGNGDALRSGYGHWTQALRRSRLGLALRPNPSVDGDLWQVTLPRRATAGFPPGRGYLLADGRVELVQVARR
jgi:S-DNA-T family DNA segregation ATPase FtsK/SpoIIIE